MRLICGLVRLDGTIASDDSLDAMIAAMTPAGLAPAVARRQEGPTAFAVLDFSVRGARSEPEIGVGADGRWLALDVRLDRPAALATTLAAGAGIGEQDLVAAALARWDVDFPDKLDGDIALASWQPERSRLLCGRDYMGVRPLCYCFVPGRFFAFASLPKGLHGAGLVAALFDIVEVGKRTAEVYGVGMPTGFRDIAWIEAGSTLVLENGAIRLHRAWRPDPARVGSWRGTAAEAAAAYRELVEAAVASRLPASGPVASHLSGGLDSSAIATIAARHLRGAGRSLLAYSLLAQPGPEIGGSTELVYIDAVLAQEPDIQWSQVHFGPPDDPGMDDIDLLPPGPDVAVDDRICALARGAGADVILSGSGGDEAATYTGPGIYAALLLRGRWRTLYRELAARAGREGQPVPNVALRRLLPPLLPQWLHRLKRSLTGQTTAVDTLYEFLSPALRATFTAVPPRARYRSRPRDRIAILTEGFLSGRGLRWAQIGARHGIAFSFPLLDRRVVDFVLSLPIERLVAEGLTRQPFRVAMTGVLPEVVRLRDDKTGPLPDVLLALARAKSRILAQVEALRAEPAVTAHFDLDRIAAAIAAAPDGDDALTAALALKRGVRQPRHFRAMRALRALQSARHVVRHGAG
jgi:asparagine synthase (glutamine-hydrolysing)